MLKAQFTSTLNSSLTSKNYVFQLWSLISSEKKKLPLIFALFFLNSLMELLGLSLLGPFVASILNPNYFSQMISSFPLMENIFVDLENVQAPIFLGCILIIISFLKLVISIFSSAKIITFSNQQITRIRRLLLKSYLKASYQEFIKRNSSEYIYTIQDLTNLFCSNVLRSLLRILSDLLIAIAIILFLIVLYGSDLLLIVIILSLGMFSFLFVMGPFQTVNGLKINDASDQIIKVTQESINGFKVLKTLQIQDYMTNALDTASLVYQKYSNRAQIINVLPRLLFEFLIIVSIVLMIFYNILLVENYEEYIPMLAVLGFAAVRLLPIFSSITNSYLMLRNHRNTVQRLSDDIIALRPKAQKHRSDIKTKSRLFQSLELKNVNFKYRNFSSKILTDLNLKLSRGEVIGIIGASGSGKSTLIDVMLGLLSPQSGDVFVNNKKVDFNDLNLMPYVMYASQEPFLIDGTVEDNLSLGSSLPEIDSEKLLKSLDLVKLIDVVQNLPHGTKAKIGERGALLSGGQIQRLILARAIYLDKKLIFLDEATSALDIKTEEEILSNLIVNKGDKTIIIISHRQNIKEFCDHVFLIKNGKINRV